MPRREVDPKLRHVIKKNNHGKFELVTHYGYLLKDFDDYEYCREYYSYHCGGSATVTTSNP